MFAFHLTLAFGLLTAPVPDQITAEGRSAYRVQSPIVHDADTLTDGVILLPFGAAVARRSIRSDYDAWEIRRGRRTVEITEAELARGRKAADDLRALLGTGTLYVAPVPPGKDTDPYDRVDAEWFYRSAAGDVRPMRDIAKERGWLRK